MAVVVAVTGKWNGAELKKAEAQLAGLRASAEKSAGGLSSAFTKASGTLKSVGARMTSVGTTATTHMTLPIVAGLALATKSWYDHTKVVAQSEAVVKSTGGAAGLTAQQLEDMANRLEVVSAVDGDLIQSGENMLATFTNIRDYVHGHFTGTFDEATGTMLDMSVALGQDTKSSAIQLGKALNDPIKGITALQRVGVSFDAQQVKQITSLEKHNKLTQAQGIILDELNKEFGGSAEAAGKAAGPMGQLMVQLRNIGDSVGSIVLPIVQQLAGWLTTWASKFEALNPKVQKIIVVVLALAAALGPVLVVLGSLITAIGAVAGVLGAISIGPFLAVVVAIGAAAYLVIKHWSTVKQWFTNTVNYLKGLWARWKDDLIPVFDEAKATVMQFVDNVQIGFHRIMQIVRPILAWLVQQWHQHGAQIKATIAGAFKAILTIVRNAFQVLRGIFQVIGGILHGDWHEVWAGIQNIVKGSVGVIVGVVKLLWNNIKGAFVSGGKNVIEYVAGLPKRIAGFFLGLEDRLYHIGIDIVKGLAQGIRDTAGDVLSAIQSSITDKIPDWVKKPLGIFSPSKVMIPIGREIPAGLAEGIKGGADAVREAVGKAAEAALKTAEDAVKAYQQRMEDRLHSVLQTFRSFAAGIKSSFTDAGSIGNVFSTDEGSASIVDQLKARAADAKKFAGQLRGLQKQGLNRQAIQQLIGLGPEQGSAAAAQLMGDKASIAQVNRFQRQIAAAGERTGGYFARQRYGSDLAAARKDARSANQTSVRVEKGAIVLSFGDGVDKRDRHHLEKVVEHAVDKSVKELVRELRARAG